MSHRPSVLDIGALLFDDTQTTHAPVAAANCRQAEYSRAQLKPMPRATPKPDAGHAPAESGNDPFSCAEHLIDIHGHWAHRVAYTCIARRAAEDNAGAERFWCDVLAAIRVLQTRPNGARRELPA